MIACGVLLWMGCKQQPTPPTHETIVASVGNHHLYASDLPQLTDENSTATDSTVFVQGYVDQWIRKTAIVLEAEAALASSFDIEKLVQNYRVSLLINNYQQKYVSERLDTAITMIDLQAEYDQSGENFSLAEGLWEVRIAKVEAKKRGLEAFYNNWKAGKEGEIQEYCDKHAEFCTSATWFTLDELYKLIPKEKFPSTKLKSGTNLQAYADGYEYFVKILNKKDVGAKPPLAYIADKLSEMVIHRRKKTLLSNLESDLYNRAMAANKIKTAKK